METIDIDMSVFSPEGKAQVEKNIAAEVKNAGLDVAEESKDFDKSTGTGADFTSDKAQDLDDLDFEVSDAANTNGGKLDLEDTSNGTLYDDYKEGATLSEGANAAGTFITKYKTPLLLAGAGLLAYYLFKK
jgi:hypothetical protein